MQAQKLQACVYLLLPTSLINIQRPVIRVIYAVFAYHRHICTNIFTASLLVFREDLAFSCVHDFGRADI